MNQETLQKRLREEAIEKWYTLAEDFDSYDLADLISHTISETLKEVVRVIEDDTRLHSCYEGCNCRKRLVTAVKELQDKK